MAHRAKHRRAALLQRAATGRTIKTDLGPDGEPNADYRAAQEFIATTETQLAELRAKVGSFLDSTGFRGLFQQQHSQFDEAKRLS